MRKNRVQFEEKLNNEHHFEDVLDLTEHCWAGNDKTQKHKNHAKKLAKKGLYGTILRKYDKVAFNVAFSEWVRPSK